MATIGDNLEDNVIDGEEDDLRNEKESDVNSDQAENDVGSGVRWDQWYAYTIHSPIKIASLLIFTTSDNSENLFQI